MWWTRLRRSLLQPLLLVDGGDARSGKSGSQRSIPRSMRGFFEVGITPSPTRTRLKEWRTSFPSVRGFGRAPVRTSKDDASLQGTREETFQAALTFLHADHTCERGGPSRRGIEVASRLIGSVPAMAEPLDRLLPGRAARVSRGITPLDSARVLEAVEFPGREPPEPVAPGRPPAGGLDSATPSHLVAPSGGQRFA